MRKLSSCVFAMALLKGVAALCPSENVVEADGYRYSRVDDALYHVQAIEYCIISSYVNLAAIKTEVASEAVNQLIRGCEEEFYFGLQYENSVDPSSWYWPDGSQLQQEQSRWESGYGNADDGKCACVLSSNQTWIDVVCGSMRPFICERNLVTIIPGDTPQWKSVGDDVTFSIRVLGSDGPLNLTMYKDEGQSKPLHTKTDVTSGSNVEFKLESITSDDNGTYVFVASGEGYERRTSVVINVQVPVTIVSDFPNEIVSPVTRGHLTIECKAEGFPNPTIHWEIDHVAVRDGSTGPGVYQNIDKNVATLYIEHAASTNDGVYVCLAENDFVSPIHQYKDTRATRLRVLGAPTIHGSEIMINCTEDELKVRLSFVANNQTLGINHIIEIRNASSSLLHESNITAFNESIVYTDINLLPTEVLRIEVTVCPDDCITALSDNRTVLNPTPISVSEANVAKVNAGTAIWICRVWWTWREQNDTDGLVNFKVRQTSVSRYQSELYVNETVLSLAKSSYSYYAEVEPYTNNTFDIFATNCVSDSAGKRARGECESGPAAPYEFLTPLNLESLTDSANTHSISVDVPDERNGPIRHGGGAVDAVNWTRLQKLSENSANDLIRTDGNEYIAYCVRMYTIFNKDNITVVLGDNKTSLCDVTDILSSERTRKQSTTVYSGFNWPLKISSTYSVSVVSTTPDGSHAVYIAQTATLTFLHEFVANETDNRILVGPWWIAIVVFGGITILAASVVIQRYGIYKSRRKRTSERREESPAEYRPNAVNENDVIHGHNDHGYELINSASVYDNVIRGDKKYHVETDAPISIRSTGNYSYCNDTS